VSVVLVAHARKMRIVKLFGMILLISHLMGCALGTATTFAESKLLSFWGTHGYCSPADGTYFVLSVDTTPAATCVGPWRQYLFCFHYALSFVFLTTFIPFPHNGPGDPYFPPKGHPNYNGVSLWRLHEHLVFLFFGVLGCIVGLYIVGAFVQAVDTSVPTRSEEVSKFCVRAHTASAPHCASATPRARSPR
jgi:hypothetical protein